MFGNIQRKREQKERSARYKDALEQNKRDVFNRSQEDQERKIKEMASTRAQEMRTQRQQARQEGRQYAEELFNRPMQGIPAQERKLMESEANQKLNRQLQGYNRQLLASQGRKGIRGGAAYAQSADLARIGQEAQSQYQRELDQLDLHRKLQNLAAMYALEQGEGAQQNLEYQTALEEQQLADERRRQRYLEDQYQRLFSRI